MKSRGAGLLACAALLCATKPADADRPVAVACLPPLASSCDPHSRKDAGSHVAAPRLRPTLVTLFNVHTREAVAIDPVTSRDEPAFLARFLRDRTSWESHPIDPGCLATLRAACEALGGERVEVVSGYRSDKLNEMLRKKGHHVAQHSQHSLGHAMDFRIVGVEPRDLLRFVRRIHHGGIGWYAQSGFVHVDTGPERQWRGE